MQVRNLRSFLAALALALFAPLAAAQFQPGMSVEQIEAQVKTQLAAGTTLEQIALQALAAGLDASIVTAALVTSSGNPAGAVSAMISAGVPVQTVVDAALAAGASADSVTQGAVAAGVPPATVQTAIQLALTTEATGSNSGASSSTPTSGGGGSSAASPS